MKRLYFLLLFLLPVLFPQTVGAQEKPKQDYYIESFESVINIEKNTDISVTEVIRVNFPHDDPRHGIYRVIPVIYSAKGKTIHSRFSLIGVANEDGKDYKVSQSTVGQSIQLKIGDPDKTLIGLNTYIIKYKLSRIIQKFSDHDELFWNVTGSEWDTQILSVSAIVNSEHALINAVTCYEGLVGGTNSDCIADMENDEAVFASNSRIIPGEDFTIVVSLDKNNNLIFPGFTERVINYIKDNWGYVFSFLPFFFIFYFWYKRGRDLRYVSENIYYKPKDLTTKTTSIFGRSHIPFVYHPIDNLTPAEAGTIIDERVHISDIVSEILELGRLGFLKIRRFKESKLFRDEIDYVLVKTQDAILDSGALNDYQKMILDEIFDNSVVKKSVKRVEKLIKNKGGGTEKLKSTLAGREYVILTELKNHFYKSLPDIKKKLYGRIADRKLFEGDPEKVRVKWIGFALTACILGAGIVFYFSSSRFNFGPLILFGIMSIPTFILAISMPRRTPEGYSYFRQIEGLKHYLKIGKWRYEIQEKALFIEEILPLAVALGVVNSITKDMKALEMSPPDYFAGSTAVTFASDLSHFNSTSNAAMLSAPGSGSGFSGRSSWSGGSGFSGGSSGGGFGGGGGGSW